MGNLSREQQELLEMLRDELQTHFEASITNTDPQLYSSENLLATANNLAGFANAAELIGLSGLASAWQCLRDNLIALTAENFNIKEDQILLIDSWTMYFMDFLQQVLTGRVTLETVSPIVNFLGDMAWPKPLSMDAKINLEEQLLNTEMAAADDKNRLPKMASAEMLSLNIGEDINADLFEGLMIELPAQVSQFAEQINLYIEHQQKAALASAQRIAHTLKGSANVVGIVGLANLMHFSEDL